MKRSTSLFNLLLTMAIFPLLFGCKKNLVENQSDPLLNKQATTLKTLGVPPDVYVAGSEAGQAKYWKNGQGFPLSDGAQATGIAVSGTDVYVCGYSYDPTTSNMVAKYWKNGVATVLSDGSGPVMANGIAILGTDVYVAGSAGTWTRTALYWKNGVATTLGAGQCNGIAVASNGDVYIPNGGWGGAWYWKNGSLVTLSTATTQTLFAMAVHGTDVYAVGVNDSGVSQKAIGWKNGSPIFFSSPANTSVMAVAVSPITGRVFYSGTSGASLGFLHITSWSPLGDITPLSSGQYVASTTGIAVDADDNVYVCGSEYTTQNTPPSKAKYWVNGQPVTLSGTTNATALAIALGQ